MAVPFQYGETSGGSSSSNSSSSNSGTLPFYNSAVQDLLNRGRQQSQAPYQAYGGDLVAGFTNPQFQAFGALQGQVGNWQPGMAAAQGGLGQAQNIFGGLLNSPYTAGALNQIAGYRGTAQFDPNQLPQYMNPYTQNVVNEIGRLGNENFQQNTLANLNSSFGDAGQFGSARNMAMAADAAAKTQREISAQQGQALNTGFNSAMQNYGQWADRGIGAGQTATNQLMGLNQFTQGLGTSLGGLAGQQGQLAGQQQQMGLTDVNALLGIGQQQQQQGQRELDSAYQQFQQQQQYPWQQLNNYAGLFRGYTAPNQSQSGSQSGSRNFTNNWTTQFRKGGLVRYAEGGLAEDDRFLEEMIDTGLKGDSPQKLAENAMNLRAGFLRHVGQRPEFNPIPEPSQLDQIGNAMLRAAGQGGAQNFGQAIGRAGAAYLDAEDRREKENSARAVAQLNIMENSLPSASAYGVGRASVNIGGKDSKYTVKMDGDKNMVVFDHSTGEATVVHRSMKGDFLNLAKMGAKMAEEQGMQDPEGYGVRFANRMLKLAPDTGAAPSPDNTAVANLKTTAAPAAAAPAAAAPAAAAPAAAAPAAAAPAAAAPGTPGVGVAPGKFALEMDKLPPEVRKQVDAAVATLKGPELEAKLTEIATAAAGVAPAAPAAPVGAPAVSASAADALKYKNKPAEKMAIESAGGVGKSAGDDYDAIMKQTTAAEAQYNAFNQLSKVAPKTGKFADIHQFAGDVFEAMGQDPSTPIIQNAIKNRQADVILSQLRNAALRAEAGIQTKSDETRIAAELPKTTDQSQAWNLITKLGRERALRRMEQGKFYTDWAETNSGDVVGTRSAWDKQMRDDPLTQKIGNKMVFRSDYLEAYKRQYPDATPEDAVAEWQQLEQEDMARKRRKP